jgi:hypothetical protein
VKNFPSKNDVPSEKVVFPFFKVTFFNLTVCSNSEPEVVVVTSITPSVTEVELSANQFCKTTGVFGMVVAQK